MSTGQIAKAERRRHPRISCKEVRFPAAFRLPDGTIREFEVLGRNVSQGGIAFWHSAPIESGTPVDLVLPTRNEEMMGVTGTVVASRAMFVFVFHEICVQFGEVLEPEDFAALALAGGA